MNTLLMIYLAGLALYVFSAMVDENKAAYIVVITAIIWPLIALRSFILGAINYWNQPHNY
jgi:hypothetical protein